MKNIKEELIEDIKEFIKINKNEDIFINPNYLNYFTQEELEDIKANLYNRKKELHKLSLDYVDKIYNKTKKDKI